MSDKEKLLIVLTLERHQDGIWITRLVNALSLVLDERKDDCRAFVIKVLTLESLLSDNINTPSCLFHDMVGIVNRVSDAAPPHLYKACLGVLHAAVACGVKVWNGPMSYATCGNKWCHHVLFHQAGLSSPETRMLMFPNDSKTTTTDNLAQCLAQSMKHPFPHLIKPNAGGFGSGMVLVNNQEELETELHDKRTEYSDGMALYQAYVAPQNEENYRVWFLNGKVQCGVVRKIPNNKAEEFTSACAGGVCSLPAQTTDLRPFASWMVPAEVVTEIQDHLLPLLPDAHAGSVEFLHDATGERLYFDLNLLSTLPANNGVDNTNGVWPANYNPWKEMAESFLQFVLEL